MPDLVKPGHVPSAVWDGLNDAGKFYLTQSHQARLAESINKPE